MARLPIPGSDGGTWGSVLNDFLAQAHHTDGSVKDVGVVAQKYSLPAAGIPRTDLSSNVQVSLDNADAAVTGSVPDASTSTKGKVQLAGDLTGTADIPTIAAGAITSTKIATDTITNTNVSGSAAIAQGKIANLTSDLAAKATDAAVVHTTGNETVTGIKNFTGTLQAGGSAVVITSDSRLSDQRVPTDTSVTTAKIVDANVTLAKLADDSVNEPKLAATNIPSSGQMLTYSGTNNFTWVTPVVGGGGVTGVTGSAPIVSTGGAAPDISITAATTGVAGTMSAADKTKLDGISAGATVTNASTVDAAGAVMNSDYTTANSLLKADAVAVTSALTVPTSTLVGRQGSGAIAALTTTQVKSLLNIASGDLSDFSSSVLATAGAMVTGNTESGITVTYNGGTNKFDFSVAQPPVRFSADTATAGTTGTDRAYAARTITSARMRCGSAPSGSALTAVVQHFNGTSWSTITTLTIADGSTTENVQSSLTQAQSVGHLLRLNVTSVGSTTAATDVVVDVLYGLI